MNQIVSTLGIESWKSVLAALLMPPVPLLLLILVGARLMFRRRVVAWLLVLLGIMLIWLTSTTAAGKWMRPLLLTPPAALDTDAVQALKGAEGTAIVVLGAGRRTLAPEYGMSTLSSMSMERLRYGLWLGRQTGLPVAFSGGVGHGSAAGSTEAEIATRIADREFGRPLRWAEARSRDTAENGLLTVPLLQESGIQRIVLVTNDTHMRRALRAFERGAARTGRPLALLPAPMGIPAPYQWSAADFLPSAQGFVDTRVLLHEWLGYALGF